MSDSQGLPRRGPADGAGADADVAMLLAQVARGDQLAFEEVYDRMAGPVLGMVRGVVRDLAQSEEVMQEVLLELWRTASRFDPGKGSALSWVMMLAHRRAVDRVRSEQKLAAREFRAATAQVDFDD